MSPLSRLLILGQSQLYCGLVKGWGTLHWAPELSFAVAHVLHPGIQAVATAEYVAVWECQFGGKEGY